MGRRFEVSLQEVILGNGESGHNLGRRRKFAQLLLVGEVECKIVDFELQIKTKLPILSLQEYDIRKILRSYRSSDLYSL